MVRRAISAATAWAVARALLRAGPPDPQRWQRTNHRGEHVTLWEGPAVVGGVCAGLLVAPALPGRTRWAALGAVATAGALGGYDDLHGATSTKGLRGHLRAMAHGEVTSGAVKVAGLSAVGLVAGAAVRPAGSAWERLLGGALVAGSANLVNLFDLRPGRALKVVGLVAAPAQLGGARAAGVLGPTLGAGAAVARDDLGERAMLGDCGANALGAALGVAGAGALPRRWLVVATGAVVGLTLASERLSFSTVIDEVAVLRWVDRLGRRPAR